MDTQFLYKCRLCEKIFAGHNIDNEKADLTLQLLAFTITNSIPRPEITRQIGIPPTMIIAHCCDGYPTKIGVADLLGFETKGE